jgi:hypothetical protein
LRPLFQAFSTEKDRGCPDRHAAFHDLARRRVRGAQVKCTVTETEWVETNGAKFAGGK